ncbi:MAG: methyltransferase domain-containing protein [Deltaproteobacteria bacterium]|nr:methyltransferase domain-containing protein [Deltaproteobacteria bacterium]
MSPYESLHTQTDFELLPGLQGERSGRLSDHSRGLVRIQGSRFPIYLMPDLPMWFVPSPAADELLRRQPGNMGTVSGRGQDSAVSKALDMEALMRSLDFPGHSSYKGRAHLELEGLSEVWFHLTDACNLQCRHCLFSCKPGPATFLPRERIEALVAEAVNIGCKLVCFTGGEPFVYPDFPDVLDSLTRRRNLRIAVLTNGLLIPRRLERIKRLDNDRIHFQISLDGPRASHDFLRGKGAFHRTLSAVESLVSLKVPCSVAMAVNAENAAHMHTVVQIVHDLGVPTVHFLWHFQRGEGAKMDRLDLEKLIGEFRKAAKKARELGVSIDNLEALGAQLFSYPGTRFDLGNAAWESLAIGPDGSVYPTPAMVGRKSFLAGNASSGIETVWRTSKLLDRIRRASLMDVPEMASDPWRFVLGGGDLDHCAASGDHDQQSGILTKDPYAPLYREMAVMLIEEEAEHLPVPDHPGLILRMGDITTDCPSDKQVNFTHCNCLLSLEQGSARRLIRTFYAERARDTDETIQNPVRYDGPEMDFIPSDSRNRSYGCGSPVADAGLQRGDTVVDLGCGAGAECFMAAKAVGPGGRVYGIDMTDAMLDVARRSHQHVREALGYDNSRFLKGYLEHVPLDDELADVVVSNCVVNLSHNKRRVFREILRILKPGGRLVISDVVTETDPPAPIRANHRLMGECIGGAFVQEYLPTLLRDMGFINIEVIKRFPYRMVQDHPFYSLTFSAYKPTKQEATPDDVMYAGPFRAVVTDNGSVLYRGGRFRLNLGPGSNPDALARAGMHLLDPGTGYTTNVDAEASCACRIPPEVKKPGPIRGLPETGCLICGEPLVYETMPSERTCVQCGRSEPAASSCRNGHYVCDLCHLRDPIDIVRRVCTTSSETDMLRLMRDIRSHERFPMHGPEHHGLVPGVILATYRNLGGPVGEDEILTGIQRGILIPGGACAYMGSCGAATGVGIAFSIILEATPLTSTSRRKVQALVGEIIEVLAQREAARCCRRECYLSLVVAARRSEDLLPVNLVADEPFSCTQHALNNECIKAACPLYPKDQSKRHPEGSRILALVKS